MSHILLGFQDVLHPATLIWVALGVFIGYVVGALPGLGKGTGVALRWNEKGFGFIKPDDGSVPRPVSHTFVKGV